MLQIIGKQLRAESSRHSWELLKSRNFTKLDSALTCYQRQKNSKPIITKMPSLIKKTSKPFKTHPKTRHMLNYRFWFSLLSTLLYRLYYSRNTIRVHRVVVVSFLFIRTRHVIPWGVLVFLICFTFIITNVLPI